MISQKIIIIAIIGANSGINDLYSIRWMLSQIQERISRLILILVSIANFSALTLYVMVCYLLFKSTCNALMYLDI